MQKTNATTTLEKPKLTKLKVDRKFPAQKNKATKGKINNPLKNKKSRCAACSFLKNLL